MEQISEYKKRYSEYLKSDEWKHLKKKVILRDNNTCQGCDAKSKSLEVHHLTYERIGNELMLDLVSLCFSCHKNIHGKEETSTWNKYITGQVDSIEKKQESLSEMIRSI